jgi:hypothetical protein
VPGIALSAFTNRLNHTVPGNSFMMGIPWMTSYMKHEFAETFLVPPSSFFTQTKKSIAKRNRTQPAQEDTETILVYALRGFTSVGRVSKMLSGINRLSLLEPLRVYHQ